MHPIKKAVHNWAAFLMYFYHIKQNDMPRIAGVTTKKDYKGNLTHVTIDIKKHKELIFPLLEQLGVVQKSQFQIDCENGMTLEAFRQSGHDFVKSLPWQK